MNTSSDARQDALELFAGEGEVRGLARDMDWSTTPLGPTTTWAPEIRTFARSIFDSPFPICLWSGPQYALIYNDPYRRILAAKHPAALGQPGAIVWGEIWDELEPQFDGVRAGGPSVYFEDAPFVMARLEGGESETAYFNYSLSPVRDENGNVVAVLNITPETTGRVRLEHRLQEEQSALAMSEERLRLAVDNADLGFWDVDVVRDELIWPPRTKAMFGISPDVPVTMGDFFDGLHPDDREATTAAYLAAADPTRRALYDVEYRTIGKEDGVTRWVAAKGRGVFDRSGQCLRVAGTALEITARKNAEIRRDALHELTQAVRDVEEPEDIAFAAAAVLGPLLGASRVGYSSIDEVSQTLITDRDWTAPDVETLTGILPLQVYGSFIDSLKLGEFTVINDVRVDPRTSGSATGLEGKSTRSFVNAPVLEQGKLVAVFFVNHPEAREWSEGDLALIKDFAERTHNAVARSRGEHALRDSERRLRELNETLEAQVEERSAERDRLWNLSEDMLARADYTGMMSAVSPAWTRVLGWTEAELLSRGYSTFMHPEDEPPTIEAIGRMAETKRPTRFENRISASDGSWKPIEWTVAPEEDGLNFIAVGRDLSAVKARDAELAGAQEALRQAQKMEAVGQLTGGLAHDFNNILAGISGSLELIGKRLAQGRVSDIDQYVTAAQGAAKRATNLTNRLLAFSRRQTLIPAPTRLSDLVDGMVELINRSVGPHVEIVTTSDPKLWNTFADVGQVENALLNLCINARDAMPDGGKLEIIVDNVQVAPTEAKDLGLMPGDYVTLSVRDYGQGMTREVLKRATEPFFTTKPIGQGTGLGLSMVYGFAGQSGGTMTIQSEVGVGTTVCLYLPRFHGPTSVDAHVEEPVTVEAIQQKKTVLLVDDEVLVRMVVADDLNDLGYNIIEAGDAASALKLVEPSKQIDLLLTDVGLPGGMNGRQLADAVLQMRPGIPVVFITGYAESSVLKDTDLGNNMRVMTKPFQIDKLAQLVRDVTEE